MIRNEHENWIVDYRHHPNAQSPKNCICVCAAQISSPINITTTNGGMLLNGLFEIVIQICPDATVYVFVCPSSWAQVHGDWVCSQDKQSSNVREVMASHHPFFLLSQCSPSLFLILSSAHLSCSPGDLCLLLHLFPSAELSPPVSVTLSFRWIHVNSITFKTFSLNWIESNRVKSKQT